MNTRLMLVMSLLMGVIATNTLLTTIAWADDEYDNSSCIDNQNCSNCLEGVFQGDCPNNHDLCILYKGSSTTPSFKHCVPNPGASNHCQTIALNPPVDCGTGNYYSCGCDTNQLNCANAATCNCSGTPGGTTSFTVAGTCTI